MEEGMVEIKKKRERRNPHGCHSGRCLCLSRFINTEGHEGQSSCKGLRPATDAPLRMDGAISQSQ